MLTNALAGFKSHCQKGVYEAIQVFKGELIEDLLYSACKYAYVRILFEVHPFKALH